MVAKGKGQVANFFSTSLLNDRVRFEVGKGNERNCLSCICKFSIFIAKYCTLHVNVENIQELSLFYDFN